MKLMTTTLLSNPKTSARLLSRFRKDEGGGMIIFSLFMFVLILWFGGMAVDLMRFETTRAKLQGTLDRATLAAADLDQTESAETIVNDYFAKAGMLQFLESVNVDEGINYRVVNANANAEMNLMFADLMGVLVQPFNPDYEVQFSSLTVRGASTAEERVTDVEVSLVLDVSGSMDRNSRIQNLRPAAREFVSAVLANNTNAPEGLITISMIPYSAVVNPGPAIEPYLNIDYSHGYSNCLLFPDNDLFTTTELDLTESYTHVAHFDPDWYSDDPSPIGYPWCHVGDHNAIVVHSTNELALHTAINALEPYGNTAIDMGMKWGTALLDPSTRDIITGLSSNPTSGVPDIADGRPYDHSQPDVLKVLVLMTDGANTQQYDLIEPYKSGQSYIWFDLDYANQPLEDVNDNEVSIHYWGVDTPDDYSDDWFYWNKEASWSNRFRNYPRGFSSNSAYKAEREASEGAVLAPGRGQTFSTLAHRASWQELYATYTFNRVNNELLSRAYSDGAIPWSTGNSGWPNYIQLPDYVDADNAINYGVVNSGEADNRLSTLCAAARAQGIIIYTVAFEAPSGGQDALLDCATTHSHFFDVDGTDISDAFSSIASDIRALKLTQ